MRPRHFVAAAAALALTAVVVPPAHAESHIEVVASGLASPRHLAFSPDGSLYVAESGSGGPRVGAGSNCAMHPSLGEHCFGLTGAITRVSDDGNDARVVTGLPSLVTEEEEAVGPFDLSFTGNSKYVVSVGLGGSDAFRDAFGTDGVLLGTLLTGKLRQGGAPTLLADVLANEAAANPDGTDVDSNPVGILRQGDGYLVADAGGNAIVRARHNGSFTTVATLPPGSALAPPFLGLPPGTQIPTDAVPTAIVSGPDGAYYVSQLTGFPFEAGDANIWRVVPGETPTVHASGLTNVTDLAFAPDGTLYAVQISDAGLLNGPIGSVVRVNPGASSHDTVVDALDAPYGLAIDGNTAYVTTNSVSISEGEVIKVHLS